jgi:3-methyladenine DNA glycosylase AlkD
MNTMADDERSDASNRAGARATGKSSKSPRSKKSNRKSASSAASKLKTKAAKTSKRKSSLKSASKKSKRSASRVKSKKSKRRKVSKAPQIPIEDQVTAVISALQSVADPRVLNDMSARYGIFTDKAFGVSMSNIQQVAKPLGSNHELALALWNTGWYEARMLTSFIDDPELVTSAQMDSWCADFDNWGICDTLCFNLFDRTPHAWRKMLQWCKRDEEFIKRAGFALLWSLTVHDKTATDDQFVQGLVMVLRGANDNRPLVKKGVNMALRAVGKRNRGLNAAAIAIARRLTESANSDARWVGSHALRELTSDSVASRLSRS